MHLLALRDRRRRYRAELGETEPGRHRQLGRDDAPLDFVPEAYRVTIFNGVTPVRTIDATTATVAYSLAQQSADFGAPPASFAFTVAQKSPLYGPGHAATATFTA